MAARDVAGRTVGVTLLATLGSVFDALTAIVTSRVLGPDGRGLYAVSLTVAAAIGVTACLGVTTAARVALASSSSRLTMGEYLGMASFHVLGAGVLGVIGTVGMVVGVLHTGTWVLLAAAGAVAAGISSSAFVFDGMHGIGRHQWATASNLAGSFAAVLLSMALWQLNVGSPAAYLLALAVSMLVQTVMGLWLLRRDGASRLRYDRRTHRRLLRSGVPALPYLSSTFFMFRIDRYLVGVLAGVDVAGIYSVAATLSEASRQLPSALGQVLLFGRASGRVSARLERRARLVVTCAVVCAVIAIGAAADLIVRGLFGKDFAGAVQPLRILLVGEVFLSIWLIDSRLLVGSDRLARASATTLASAVVLVAGAVALIPRYQAEGAATASVLAYALAAASAKYLLRGTAGERDRDSIPGSRNGS